MKLGNVDQDLSHPYIWCSLTRYIQTQESGNLKTGETYPWMKTKIEVSQPWYFKEFIGRAGILHYYFPQ